MWASCTQSSMMIAFAAVAIATVLRPGPPGWRKQLLAALFLVATSGARRRSKYLPHGTCILHVVRSIRAVARNIGYVPVSRAIS